MKADPDLIEERAREAHSVGTPDWAGLIPAGVAALGPPSRPVERLMGTQRAVYRLIVWLGNLRAPRPSEPAATATIPQTDTPAGA
jgi:hypothetical protein